jgi:hypothetical protein
MRADETRGTGDENGGWLHESDGIRPALAGIVCHATNTLFGWAEGHVTSARIEENAACDQARPRARGNTQQRKTQR